MKNKKLWRKVSMSPRLEEKFKHASIEAKIKASQVYKEMGRQLEESAQDDLERGQQGEFEGFRSISQSRS